VTDPRLVADLEARGATGLLLPGVDGDVAGLYTFARGDMQALEGALAARRPGRRRRLDLGGRGRARPAALTAGPTAALEGRGASFSFA
jgi:hypothetical protein